MSSPTVPASAPALNLLRFDIILSDVVTLLPELVGGDATLTGVAADVFTYNASMSACAKQ